MKSKLIVMLTHNDQTVHNALEVFEACKDLPVECWGFKDVGLPVEEMKALVGAMKMAGKTTFLEVVTYTEAECMRGAKLAVECGFDYLMGTLYFPAVWEYLRGKEIRYFPFVGKVSGSPSVLEGTVEEMLAQAGTFAAQGIHGIDLLAYRRAVDPEGLAEEFVRGVKIPTVVAGSIGSEERIGAMSRIQPFAFTMRSALFTANFVPDGSFRANLEEVLKIMDRF